MKPPLPQWCLDGSECLSSRDNQIMRPVLVSLTCILGQRKSKCQMNDRVGERGRKTKPPPAVRYLRREDLAAAAHSPGTLQTGTRPRDWRAPPQSGPPPPRCPPAGRRAPRGKLAAGGAAALRMQLLAVAAAPTGPRDPAPLSPTPRLQAAAEDAAQWQRAPGAPLSGSPWRPAQRAGAALAFVRASSFAPRALRAPRAAQRAAPRRRPPPAYAAPPAPPADRVESAAAVAAAAGTREAMSPARARDCTAGPGAATRFRAELGGPAAPGSPLLALQASPASRAPAILRLPFSAPRRPARPPARRHLPPAPRARAPAPTAVLRPAHLRRCCRPSREKPRQHLPARPCGALGWGPPARRGPGKGWGWDGRDSQTLASWTFLRKVRESGAGEAGRRTNPEAAEEPELLSCDAEG